MNERERLSAELEKLTQQLGAMGVDERRMRVATLESELSKQGIVVTPEDRELLGKFARDECSFDDVVRQFQARVVAAGK